MGAANHLQSSKVASLSSLNDCYNSMHAHGYEVIIIVVDSFEFKGH